jgi:hypothetical protein
MAREQVDSIESRNRCLLPSVAVKIPTVVLSDVKGVYSLVLSDVKGVYSLVLSDVKGVYSLVPSDVKGVYSLVLSDVKGMYSLVLSDVKGMYSPVQTRKGSNLRSVREAGYEYFNGRGEQLSVCRRLPSPCRLMEV